MGKDSPTTLRLEKTRHTGGMVGGTAACCLPRPIDGYFATIIVVFRPLRELLYTLCSGIILFIARGTVHIWSQWVSPCVTVPTSRGFIKKMR